MYNEPLYGEKIMMKKVVKVVSYVPLKLVKWSLFPVAFLHAQLKRLEYWLYDKVN
jgi:hypothetical protein